MIKKGRVSHVGDADLKLLRIFKSVAESGGLSAAENELGIGRSTISKHISDLELRLGMKLCNRGPAGFSLTEEGEKILHAAESLLLSVAGFVSEVNEINQELAGTIRVALFDQCASNPESHLSRAIQAFNQSAPAVQIDLSIEPPNVIETHVIQGQIDVGIIALHRPSDSLAYAPLYGENMYLYCGVGHPFFEQDQSHLSLDDVRSSNYAGISFNSPNMQIGQQLKFRRSAQVQSEHALAILIMSGRYTGFLPDHLAIGYVQRGLMKAVLPDRIHYRTSFAAITRKRPGPTRVTERFLNTLADEHSS